MTRSRAFSKTHPRVSIRWHRAFAAPVPSRSPRLTRPRVHRAMRELRCAIKHYDWGVRGASACRTLALANARRNDGAFDENTLEDVPFAELWAGTHPSGDSVVRETNDTLSNDVKARGVDALGAACVARFGKGEMKACDVPFLMKILSVSKALSVQAHPDKALAKILHERDPKNYADDNHKPEMALCVSEAFEALSGFVSAEELVASGRAHAELKRAAADEAGWDALERAVVSGSGDEDADTRGAFRRVFTALMTAEKANVVCELTALETRLRASETRDAKETLFLRLCEQYPGDVGAFCAFVLNFITLTPGQAIVMAANEPHAYLSGDCVEVMATSDNVVRAGLTPKFRDVQVLCDMLTYKLGAPKVLTGEPVDACTRTYVPPFEEFALDVVELGPRMTHAVAPRSGPSVWIIHRGSCVIESRKDDRQLTLTSGAVIFVDAGEETIVQTSDDCLVAYVARTNVST